MLIRLSYCNNSIRFVAQVFALAPRFFLKSSLNCLVVSKIMPTFAMLKQQCTDWHLSSDSVSLLFFYICKRFNIIVVS